jgi:hypothetical protein
MKAKDGGLSVGKPKFLLPWVGNYTYAIVSRKSD